MSVQAMMAVKKRVWGSTVRKAVALVLADYCDAEWSCFVGQQRLADEAEVSERSVRKVLADFEAEDLLVREHRYRGKGGGGRTSDRLRLIQESIERLPAVTSANRLPADDAGLPAAQRAVTGSSFAGEQLGEPTEEPTVSRDNDFEKEFTRFWELYPRRVARAAALKAFVARLREGVDLDELLAAAATYAADCRAEARDERFIMHASTFLGPNHRYEDFVGRDPDALRMPRGADVTARSVAALEAGEVPALWGT